MTMEIFIAWVLLFFGIFSGDAQWYIASGVFAIAGNINNLWKTVKENDNG
jgi:hypothetical protein